MDAPRTRRLLAPLRIAGLSGLVLGLVLGLGGCSHMARDTATYERDTAALLDTRAEQVQACYEAALARNPKLVVGTVTVTFQVNKKTGKFSPPQWVRNRTTVNETLATCVVTALSGLALAEPDRRDGDATFSYSFRGTPAP